MDENPLEVLTLVVGALDHVHTLDLSKIEVLEDRKNPRFGDVRKHPRNADAWLTRSKLGGVDWEGSGGRWGRHGCFWLFLRFEVSMRLERLFLRFEFEVEFEFEFELFRE